MKVATKLAKWSRRGRVRDKSTCLMCGRKRKKKKAGRKPLNIQFHHIYPKYLFPWKMFELSNGVTLCFRCHRRVVHFSYLKKSWLRFAVMFRQYNRRKAIRAFSKMFAFHFED